MPEQRSGGRSGARRRLLAIALELLVGAEAQQAPLVVTFVRGRVRAEHTFTPEQILLFQAVQNLADTHQNIVEALHEAGEELSARQLASLAGYRYNSHFRSALAELQAVGAVEATSRGYRLRASSQGTPDT